MFSLVIKEKTGIYGGWLEMDGAEHVIPFGDFQDDVEQATETLVVWSDWMQKEIDMVLEITNGKGVSFGLKPCLVESIALVYTRS